MSSPASVPIPGFRPHTVLGQDRMSIAWLAADERGRTAVLAIGHRVLAGQADRGAFLACAATPSRIAASPSIADVLAAVHAAGLAHGAVGPATILLSGNRPVLSRFDVVAPAWGSPLRWMCSSRRNTSVLPWKAASQLPVP